MDHLEVGMYCLYFPLRLSPTFCIFKKYLNIFTLYPGHCECYIVVTLDFVILL